MILAPNDGNENPARAFKWKLPDGLPSHVSLTKLKFFKGSGGLEQLAVKMKGVDEYDNTLII
jgi:hypothetical protein